MEPQDIIFFGKKLSTQKIGSKTLSKILCESTEKDNKYRFSYDDDSGYSDYSNHTDHSDYSAYSDYSDYNR